MTEQEIMEMACQSFGGVVKKEERENFISFAKLIEKKSYNQGWRDCMDEHSIPRCDFDDGGYV
jgi:hypothetical protein